SNESDGDSLRCGGRSDMRDVYSIPSILAGVLAASLVIAPAHADKKQPALDHVWTHPAYAGFGVDRIAVLPIATYDGNLQAAVMTEQALGQALRASGYRWVGSSSARDLLRVQVGGDSLLKLLTTRLLSDPRPDSLLAPRLCAMLRCDALLATRVDQWQQT